MLENTETVATITEDSAGLLALGAALARATHIAANTGGYLGQIRKKKRIFRRIVRMIEPRVVGYSHGLIVEPVYEHFGRFCSVADLVGETVLVSRLVTDNPTLTICRVNSKFVTIVMPSGQTGAYVRVYRWAFAIFAGVDKHT